MDIPKNHSCSIFYIAHFTPKKGDIGPNQGSILKVFHLISISWLGPTPFSLILILGATQ